MGREGRTPSVVFGVVVAAVVVVAVAISALLRFLCVLTAGMAERWARISSDLSGLPWALRTFCRIWSEPAMSVTKRAEEGFSERMPL